MDIESMKKPDLVKALRSAEQELKMLNMKLSQLEAEKASEDEPFREIELPYKAVSMFCDRHNGGYTVLVRFNLEGDAVVDMDTLKRYREVHLANFTAVKIFEEDIAKQKFPTKKQPMEDEVNGNK